MKILVLLSIYIYQKIISIILKNLLGIRAFCRFSPTCSEYAKNSILEYGIIKGGKKSLMRLLRCQPFVKMSS